MVYIQYFLIYTHPILLIILTIYIRDNFINNQSKFKSQKFTQTLVYYFEIFYSTLFFTSIINYLNDNYFFLWNSTHTLDEIITRFINSFTIYQITIIIIRKLNSSADIDSYQSIKQLVNLLILFHENNLEDEFKSTIQEFRKKEFIEQEAMLNDESKELFYKIEQLEFQNKDTLIYLKKLLINLEHIIDTTNFHWVDSYLLNIFK